MPDRSDIGQGDDPVKRVQTADDSRSIQTDAVEDPNVDNKAVANAKHGDIALQLASELDASYEPSPAVEKRALRKIDFILLPIIACTATLSFLDKVSNNYANNVRHNPPP